MLTNKQWQKTLDELEWLKKFYNENFAIEKKPFSGAYDRKLRTELRAVVKRINEDVDKAAAHISTVDGKPGRPPKDRILLTKLHLFQQLFDFKNREMECFSLMFLLQDGETYFSYKSIERAYSDPIVAMILHNLFVLSAGSPRKVDASGDGTGLALKIGKHYRKVREKDLKKEKDTSTNKKKRKEFLFSVALLDLDTNLYIGYAAGFKSEKKLFKEALEMVKQAGFKLDSITLDKYYSGQSIFQHFDKETRVIVIPKKNSTIRGPTEWKQLLLRVIETPMGFFREYYRRNKSESNFSKDKRKFGVIRQKLPERRITAGFTRAILHNFSMQHLHGEN